MTDGLWERRLGIGQWLGWEAAGVGWLARGGVGWGGPAGVQSELGSCGRSFPPACCGGGCRAGLGGVGRGRAGGWRAAASSDEGLGEGVAGIGGVNRGMGKVPVCLHVFDCKLVALWGLVGW